MFGRALLLFFALTVNAWAQTAPRDAQAAYAERRALIAADDSCQLFSTDVRVALEAGAWQARSALMRQGWTSVRVRELETAAAQAAQARGCGDPRTETAARAAVSAYAAWVRAPSFTYPGTYRSWIARRAPGDGAWRLQQDIAAPTPVTFGVRQTARGDEIVLMLPGGANASSAQLAVRDARVADAQFLDAPGRVARGLEAGAPQPAIAVRYWANGRRVETTRGVRSVAFTFPREALAALTTLDPREAAVITLQGPGAPARYLLEVGDLRAAIAYLDAASR